MKKPYHYFVLLGCLICFSQCTTNDPAPEDDNSVLEGATSIEEGIYLLVNQHRNDQGLPELEWSEACSSMAYDHSKNMADGTVAFGHDGFNNRFEELGDQLPITRMGENVAFGQKTAAEVMESWLNSTGHRENIEGDFTHIGVGIAPDGDDRLYFTQIFIKM